jgi:hypothetical protein
MSNLAAPLVRLPVQKSSLTATVLAVITAVAGLVVGLGVINVGQEGIVVAATTAALGAAAVVANAIHTGTIEPSAIVAAVGAVAVQVVALLVSFAWISNEAAGTVIAITTAVVLAIAQVAHAVLSRRL